VRRGLERIRCAEFRECVGDDAPPGKVTSFPLSVDLQEGEVVVFSWIVYASRAERDAINDKAMNDPRMAHFMDPTNLPFDGKRMIYGGFEMMIVRLHGRLRCAGAAQRG
jgi:uncharacterized protein YbaA (DUF1428 family)